MNTQTDAVTLTMLEQTVIERLNKEAAKELIDIEIIESLTKTLDIVSHHLNRRDDILFRASEM
ncbi:hypothetical protein EVJ32_09465 [Exiguobacterium sp. SH5S4]|uniref:hypothetical protein n=1 Tax=Exiguobacterium sp. SH5S4 TaxID=2510961 RepID=UPI001039A4F7|nr:hypothetical protein [Exiguobacterium sp. SH5S4]TCI25542.1 hypothetical protein EVJ32_09465 [Exiguobacterium sp. SH5S4]